MSLRSKTRPGTRPGLCRSRRPGYLAALAIRRRAQGYRVKKSRFGCSDLRARLPQSCASPPSTSNSAPVTYEASGESRKAATPATSIGLPKRPRGTALRAAAPNSLTARPGIPAHAATRWQSVRSRRQGGYAPDEQSRAGSHEAKARYAGLEDTREGRNAFSYLLNSHHELFAAGGLASPDSSEAARQRMLASATRVGLAALQAQIRDAREGALGDREHVSDARAEAVAPKSGRLPAVTAW